MAVRETREIQIANKLLDLVKISTSSAMIRKLLMLKGVIELMMIRIIISTNLASVFTPSGHQLESLLVVETEVPRIEYHKTKGNAFAVIRSTDFSGISLFSACLICVVAVRLIRTQAHYLGIVGTRRL